jgi:hypothetical protein
MEDVQKMLRTIINGQSIFRQEILSKIDKLDRKLTLRIENVEGKLDKVGENLTKRLDKIGSQLAYLEDDTPTREEFDNLEKKIKEIDQKATSTI